MLVQLNMTMTLNGLAAQSNDSTAIFEHGEWPLFVQMVKDAGALIWGRRTHEIVRGYGPEALALFDGLGRVVLTHDRTFALEPGWQAASSPEGALTAIESAGGRAAVVGGGGTTNASFLAAGLVNEIVLFLEPVVLGQGVPAFAAKDYEQRLQLGEVRQVDDSLIQLRYSVTAR